MAEARPKRSKNHTAAIVVVYLIPFVCGWETEKNECAHHPHPPPVYIGNIPSHGKREKNPILFAGDRMREGMQFISLSHPSTSQAPICLTRQTNSHAMLLLHRVNNPPPPARFSPVQPVYVKRARIPPATARIIFHIAPGRAEKPLLSKWVSMCKVL